MEKFTFSISNLDGEDIGRKIIVHTPNGDYTGTIEEIIHKEGETWLDYEESGGWNLCDPNWEYQYVL